MTNERDLLRFCACCPAPCRSAITIDGGGVPETQTPSSLALIALAVLEGRIAPDGQVLAILRRTGPARQCVAACPYGHDIATAVEKLAANTSEPTRATSDEYATGSP